MQFKRRRSLPNAARIQTERSRWPSNESGHAESQILEYMQNFHSAVIPLILPLVWLWFEIPPECGANLESSSFPLVLLDSC